MYKEIVQDIFNCYNNFYISLFQYRLNVESKNKDCHIKWKKNHFKTLSCTSSSFHKYSQTKKNTYATYASKVQNFRRISLIADISVHVTGHDIICRNWNSFVTF